MNEFRTFLDIVCVDFTALVRPSREGPKQASVIDQIRLSGIYDCQSDVTKRDISDHYVVFAIIPRDPTGQRDVTCQFWYRSKGNLFDFKIALFEIFHISNFHDA